MYLTGFQGGLVAHYCEHINGPLGSIKSGEFDLQINYQLLKAPAQWNLLLPKMTRQQTRQTTNHPIPWILKHTLATYYYLCSSFIPTYVPTL